MRKDRKSDEIVGLNMYMESDSGINEIANRACRYGYHLNRYYYPHIFYKDKNGSLLGYDEKTEIWRWKKSMPFYNRCELCSVQHMYKINMLNEKDAYKEIYVNKGTYNHEIIV